MRERCGLCNKIINCRGFLVNFCLFFQVCQMVSSVIGRLYDETRSLF
jgi:hypothetical protein